MHSLLKYALPCPQAAVLKPPGRNAEIREVHPETGRPCEKELLRPDAESFPLRSGLPWKSYDAGF